ncbi:MAG: ABC transporter permease [Lachnospiraceae bacterium]|nr:ABC transporter permease [Lachnospiraceae bacterium]
MLKVNNRRLISEMAASTWKAGKKRNLLTIFAIFLTTFLIASVLAIGSSYWNTLSQRQVRMSGMDYDIELPEPREDQIEKTRAMDNVKFAGLSIKCAVITDYGDIQMDKTRLYYLDETCWQQQCIPALEFYEGKYPEKENEIMLSLYALEHMGIQNPSIGMTLSLDYYTLVGKDSDEEHPLQKSFTLSGWYRDYTGASQGYVSKAFQEASGVTQTDFTQGKLKITLKNPLYSEKEIVEMQNALDLQEGQLIYADSDLLSSFLKAILVLAGLLLMVFLSGYLFIYNALYISIAKNIRYYGQLKTLGMTAPQLRSMIYRESLWNGLIGTFLGLTVGILTASSVIPALLTSMNQALSPEEIWQSSPAAYVIAGLFALLTNFIGSRKPIKIAEDCSPIEAVHFSSIQQLSRTKNPKTGRKKRFFQSGNNKPEKRRSSYFSGSIAMARQNMFRDKKQAVIILLSFTTSLTIFLSIHVLIRANDAKAVLNATRSDDIYFLNQTTLEENLPLLTEEKIGQIRRIPGVKSVRRVASAAAILPYQPGIFDKYFEELCASRYSPGDLEDFLQSYRKDPEAPKYATRLNIVDEEGFPLLNTHVGGTLDKEAFMRGEIAVAYDPWSGIVSGDWEAADAQMLGKEVVFSLPDGPHPEESYHIKIGAVGSYTPAHFSGGYPPALIVSEDLAKELLGELYTEKISVVYEKPFSKDTEEQIKAVFADETGIGYDSKLDSYEDMQKTEQQVRILGTSLGLIIAFLALLNYCNMMAASLQDRAKEFATLESIGMTTKQTRQVLMLEGIGYALLSAVSSLIIGTPLSIAVFNGTNQYWNLRYSFPLADSLILYLIILILCMLVPAVLYQRTKKTSIVERLRQIQAF